MPRYWVQNVKKCVILLTNWFLNELLSIGTYKGTGHEGRSSPWLPTQIWSVDTVTVDVGENKDDDSIHDGSPVTILPTPFMRVIQLDWGESDHSGGYIEYDVYVRERRKSVWSPDEIQQLVQRYSVINARRIWPLEEY